MNIVLRSHLGSAASPRAPRWSFWNRIPVPVTRMRTIKSVVTSSTAAPRSLTMLLTASALLAIGVGSIGVYSLISYTVSWRTREIGLRLALGANRLQIAKLVAETEPDAGLLGSALGIGGAVAVTRLMGRFLFETSPARPADLLAGAAAVPHFGGVGRMVPRASRRGRRSHGGPAQRVRQLLLLASSF